MIKVGTLFSGGLAAPEFALKYENIKHEVVFACEIDKYARKQYLKFHEKPTSKFYEDITTLDGTKYKNQIDLLVWGSPCQDLSISNKDRKGLDGDRSSLFRIGAKIQEDIKPRVFIFENVKGLLSSNNGNDYKEVCDTFEKQGYSIKTLKMNTRDFGIPQNRPRIFIVGFLNIEDYKGFEEPKKINLETKLKDLCEKEVDEKYYLSQKILDYYKNHATKKRGFKLKPFDLEKNEYSFCLTTKINRPTNTHIKTGLERLGYIKKNTQGTRVYDINGVSSCLGANGGGMGAKTGLYVDENKEKFAIRRLTPKETFRL